MTVTQKEKQLLKKLPQQWRTQLHLLFNQSLPGDKVVSMATMMYYRQANQDTQSWDELLRALSRQEPATDLQGNLSFQHLLWAFPVNFVELFLKFLLRLHHTVSADSLGRFMTSVFSSGQRSPQVHCVQRELVSSLAVRGERCFMGDLGQDPGLTWREMLVQQATVDLHNTNEILVKQADLRHVDITHRQVDLCPVDITHRQADLCPVDITHRQADLCPVDITHRHLTRTTVSHGGDLKSGVLTHNATVVSDSVCPVQTVAENTLSEYTTSCSAGGLSSDPIKAGTNQRSQDPDNGISFTEILHSRMNRDSLPAASRSLQHGTSSKPDGGRAYSSHENQDGRTAHCRHDCATQWPVNSAEDVTVTAHSLQGGCLATQSAQADGLETEAELQLQTPQCGPGKVAFQSHGVSKIPHDGEASGLELWDKQEQTVRKLQEVLFSGDTDESADLDLDVLSAIPSSQMLSVCEMVGLNHVGDASLPVLVERLSAVSSKLTLSSSTAIISCIVKEKYKDLKVPPSRQVMACLSDLVTAFPHQLANVLGDCLQELPCNSTQADVVASLSKTLDPSSLIFFLSSVCSPHVELDHNLLTILQSVLTRQPDLNPDLLDRVLHLLETGASLLARSAKYGRLLLNLVRSYKNQLTSEHSPVLQNIMSVHTSVIRKSLHSAMQDCMRQ